MAVIVYKDDQCEYISPLMLPTYIGEGWSYEKPEPINEPEAGAQETPSDEAEIISPVETAKPKRRKKLVLKDGDEITDNQ